MSKTLTIMLLSGYQENEDPIFTVRLAEAALKAGYKVNIFLFDNAVNLANKEKPIEGKLHIQERLRKHVEIGKIGDRLDKLAEMGAEITTCHTNEYGRGTEADEYRDGIKWGDVGQSFTTFLLTSDVHVSIGH
ncbi:MAG: DsrE family protein [Deltaproteobacteria bacterium]|nr:DsrE family protein [Deltaproteobacteria bacterium]